MSSLLAQTALVTLLSRLTGDGVGQYLDSQCLNLMEGEDYEVNAKLKLEVPGNTAAAVECDPNDKSSADHCPSLALRIRYYDENGDRQTETRKSIATLVRRFGSKKIGTSEWASMHGNFRVDHRVANALYVFAFVEQAQSSWNYLLDDVSIKVMQPNCEQMIQNSGIDEDAFAWDSFGFLGSDLEVVSEDADNFALQSSNRDSHLTGVQQDISRNCLVEGSSYSVTGKLKLKDPTDGSLATCDESTCPIAKIRAEGDTGSTSMVVATVVLGSSDPLGWMKIQGTFVATAAQISATYLYLYVEGAPATLDMIVDDIMLFPSIDPPTTSPSFKPIPGPIVFYKFDGDTSDSLGLVDGTPMGSVQYETDEAGTFASFDQTADRLGEAVRLAWTTTRAELWNS